MELVPVKQQSLARARFEALAEVPPEEEWLENMTNCQDQARL